MVENSSKFRVALEFNFSRRKILKAVRKRNFKTAGDLIGYLWEHIDSDSDGELEEEESGKRKGI